MRRIKISTELTLRSYFVFFIIIVGFIAQICAFIQTCLKKRGNGSFIANTIAILIKEMFLWMKIRSLSMRNLSA